MFGLQKAQGDEGLLSSSLLTQDSFYGSFARDLIRAKHEVIIESPFISFKRLDYLLPTLRKLAQHKVQSYY